MTVTVQEQLPAWYFARYGRSPYKADIDLAQDWVQKALRLTKRPVHREFEGRGFTVRTADLSWPQSGGRVIRLRAKLNLRGKELILDARAEDDLQRQMGEMGFPANPTARQVIMAHELFHVFCPKCPAVLAELAAHLYASDLLDLGYFPGILDISHRFTQNESQLIA